MREGILIYTTCRIKENYTLIGRYRKKPKDINLNI